MNAFLLILLAGLIGYLWGAIPFGFLFVRWTKGVDLRDIGSGRTGGTNSMRAAGPVVGTLTALSDVLKGACAIWLARWLFTGSLGAALPWAEMAAGVLAVVGHNWSVFLRFRGGAGTGPNVGWSTAVWWPMFPIGTFFALLVLVTNGMASVASMMIGVTIPAVFAIRYFAGLDVTPAYMIGGLITLSIVLFSLRPNIRRILNGTERVVGPAARRKQRRSPTSKQTES
jgi:glycerol-3-phosphate acyltransferase PlsY